MLRCWWGNTDPLYHGTSRSPILEGEATNRVIRLAETAGAPVYIVHLSAREALNEVRRARGASRTARKALGFEELLDGDVQAMKRRTRNYAKRQLTWMRKLPGAELVDVTGREPDDVARELVG